MSSKDLEENTTQTGRASSLRGIVSGQRYLSHRALSTNAARAATALHDAGVWQGDAVALLLRNDFAFFEASLAASQLGALTVPLNWHMTADEIAYVLDDCEAKIVIAHSDLLSESVLAVCEGRELVSVSTPPEIATAYKIDAKLCQAARAIPEWYSWIAAYPERTEESRAVLAPMFYTSGTTGLPKGVKRKAISPEIGARVAARTGAAFFGEEPGEISSIMTGPLYHSAPNAYGMRIIREGGLLILQPRFSASELLHLIDHYAISHLHMVPTMFTRLLALDESERSAFSGASLRHVAHGAAPCPPDVKEAMINWWGEVIVEYYAMTETGIIATCDSTQWMAHKGTVGHAAQGVELKIMSDSDEVCAAGVVGEVCIKSETSALVSYHHDKDKTEKLRRAGYLATGDIGYLDKDGFLFISDRKSDMVISGGVNIYPAEVENTLIGFSGVKDCAVFGVQDTDFGERLIALLEVPTPDQTAFPDKADITAFLRERIAAYKVPREILFTATLPREDSGKIKKRLLRREYSDGNLKCLTELE